MYSWIFDFFYNAVKLSDNWILNIVLPLILYAILHIITFSIVGNLYNLDLIDGSFQGKVAYLLVMFINILITTGILYLIKGIIWVYNFLKSLTLFNWISIIGVVVLIIFLVVAINIIINRKQEGE